MKIGLFGGTFSPPHNGHVRAARLFCEKLQLDRLIVMPDFCPPHKDADSFGTPEIRLEMTRLAFSDFAEVSDYECKKGGRSFTVDTVAYLSEKYQDDSLYMLVGEDMFLSFESWKEPERILKKVTLVCVKRTASKADGILASAECYRRKYGADIVIIEDEPFCVSSSEIREMCSGGESIDALVPNAVSEFIKQKGLYIS